MNQHLLELLKFCNNESYILEKNQIDKIIDFIENTLKVDYQIKDNNNQIVLKVIPELEPDVVNFLNKMNNTISYKIKKNKKNTIFEINPLKWNGFKLDMKKNKGIIEITGITRADIVTSGKGVKSLIGNKISLNPIKLEEKEFKEFFNDKIISFFFKQDKDFIATRQRKFFNIENIKKTLDELITHNPKVNNVFNSLKGSPKEVGNKVINREYPFLDSASYFTKHYEKLDYTGDVLAMPLLSIVMDLLKGKTFDLKNYELETNKTIFSPEQIDIISFILNNYTLAVESAPESFYNSENAYKTIFMPYNGETVNFSILSNTHLLADIASKINAVFWYRLALFTNEKNKKKHEEKGAKAKEDLKNILSDDSEKTFPFFRKKAGKKWSMVNYSLLISNLTELSIISKSPYSCFIVEVEKMSKDEKYIYFMETLINENEEKALIKALSTILDENSYLKEKINTYFILMYNSVNKYKKLREKAYEVLDNILTDILIKFKEKNKKFNINFNNFEELENPLLKVMLSTKKEQDFISLPTDLYHKTFSEVINKDEILN